MENSYPNKKYISIDSIDIFNKKKVVAKVRYSQNIKKYFFTDTFFIEYDCDIDSVDEGILVIPFLSNIITVAWALGADIYLKEIDKDFLYCLTNKIKPVFEKWFSAFSFSTNIHVERVILHTFTKNGYGLLFSGGVDSLASYIRYKDKKPDLIAVWGADIPYHKEKFWNVVKEKHIQFAYQEKVNINFIRTNIRSINTLLLKKKYDINWWGEVQHGLGLLGLCAPITAVNDIRTMIIASSYFSDITLPWGSHPWIDNNIQWSDVKVIHDGYDTSRSCYVLTRQEKIRLLKSYPNYLSFLRVCYMQHLYGNCGTCEKCLRTIVGLALEDIDPKKCNFNISDINITLNNIENGFLKREIYLEPAQIEVWEDIQKHIPSNINELNLNYKNFFLWFKELDLSNYSKNLQPPIFKNFLYMIRYRNYPSIRYAVIPLLRAYLSNLMTLIQKKN